MITLYTAATPNGHKVSIGLEEFGLAYEVRPIDFGAREQKQAWFLQINPNGRIPAIVDHEAEDFAVFESGAILVYLAEKAGKLMPASGPARSQVMQWLMFQMGGVGPMMGQANVFFRYASEKIPYAIERYQRESRRLCEVLNTQLKGQDFLVGEYSIADIANFAWIRTYEWSGLTLEGLDDLQAWIDRIAAREAVIRGLEVPEKRLGSTEEVVGRAREMLV